MERREWVPLVIVLLLLALFIVFSVTVKPPVD
jgi:hypothetical protein